MKICIIGDHSVTTLSGGRELAKLPKDREFTFHAVPDWYDQQAGLFRLIATEEGLGGLPPLEGGYGRVLDTEGPDVFVISGGMSTLADYAEVLAMPASEQFRRAGCDDLWEHAAARHVLTQLRTLTEAPVLVQSGCMPGAPDDVEPQPFKAAQGIVQGQLDEWGALYVPMAPDLLDANGFTRSEFLLSTQPPRLIPKGAAIALGHLSKVLDQALVRD
ncbi:MAG: hypothetical protein AB3N22_14960 [Ruegeria sp.]